MSIKNQQSGAVLVAIIITLPFMLLILALYMQLTVNSLILGKRDQSRTHAQLATDAGIDAAMEQINQDSTWAGTGSEVELHNDGNVRTTYQVAVTSVSSSSKTLVSTGRTYRPVTASTPEANVTVTVAVRGVQSGAFSIVSGVGGLIMRNSAKVVSGNVYVNGTLQMSNTAQIGLLSLLPVDVKVAHQSCPIPSNPTHDAQYPRICNSGENGQPITINHPASIFGDVHANNQTNGARMSSAGLCASTVPACASEYPVAAIPLPDYDRTGHKAAANAADAANSPDAQTGAAAGCSVGIKSWQANLKINGNVTVSNLCAVTVHGNIWITGNFEMRNLAILKVAEGLTEPPVIMIDGSSGFDIRNGASMLPNLLGTGFRVITFYSAASGCSPDCTTVTGSNLYNSQSHETIVIDNGALAPRTEFYARWTKLTAGNSGSIGALAGQTIELTNSISVTFGTSVTGFGETAWILDSYRRTF